MPTKRKAAAQVHEHIGVKITRYDVDIGASINFEIDQARTRFDETPVYDMGGRVDIVGDCLYPDERAGERYEITIYADTRRSDFKRTLSDFRVVDDRGLPKSRKRGDQYIPLYEPPKDVGYIEKVRGERSRRGACWVSLEVMSYLVSLTGTDKPLFMTLHELRIGRSHGIRGFTVQTKDPEEE